jgi:hypothetical protein
VGLDTRPVPGRAPSGVALRTTGPRLAKAERRILRDGRADNLTRDTAVQEPKRPEELAFLPGAFHQADAVAEIAEIEETR